MFTEEALRCFCDSPSVVEDGKREFTAGAVSPFVFDGNGTFRATVAPRMMQVCVFFPLEDEFFF